MDMYRLPFFGGIADFHADGVFGSRNLRRNGRVDLRFLEVLAKHFDLRLDIGLQRNPAAQALFHRGYVALETPARHFLEQADPLFDRPIEWHAGKGPATDDALGCRESFQDGVRRRSRWRWRARGGIPRCWSGLRLWRRRRANSVVCYECYPEDGLAAADFVAIGEQRLVNAHAVQESAVGALFVDDAA